MKVLWLHQRQTYDKMFLFLVQERHESSKSDAVKDSLNHLSKAEPQL